jgi:hypothetical protein
VNATHLKRKSFCAGVYFVSSLRSGGAKDLVESGKQLLKLLILEIVRRSIHAVFQTFFVLYDFILNVFIVASDDLRG